MAPAANPEERHHETLSRNTNSYNQFKFNYSHMDSPAKPRNQKLEAMRSRIKATTPLITSRFKPDLSLLASPTTPQDVVLTPNSALKIEGFSAYSNFADLSQAYLKNAFEQKYEIMQKLGEGANGVVRKCMNRLTNEVFAVKIGKMEEEHILALVRIVHMMRRLKHQNILSIKELYHDRQRSKYYQVLEYLPYPSLKQLISQGFVFTPDKIKKIMKQLLSALIYFHRHFIVHRDIKTSNLLYDTQKERLYVIDLGIITKTVHRGKRRNLWSNNGTLEYKAPEMLLGSSYNQSVDLWAAGVVLYELVEGRTPFKEESHFDIIDNITQIKYSFNQEPWKDIPLAKQLVTMLLKPKNQRLSAREALKAPWFQEIDWEQMTIKKQSPDTKEQSMLNSSAQFPKPDYSYGSVMIMNRGRKESELDDLEFEDLTICNPYHLRMSSYDTIDKEALNLSQILNKKEDKMIINNNT